MLSGIRFKIKNSSTENMISQVFTSDDPVIIPSNPKINIDDLVDRKLSPAPGSLLRLVKLLSDYSTPRPLLIKEINRDPVLVARILRLANSAMYAFEREIILIDMALTAIGSQTIYDIVVVELAARMVNSNANRTKAFRNLWEHSIAVAVITKKISQTMEMRGLEESFVCGLLHDFGKFVLLNYDADHYEEILTRESEFEMLRSEDERYGFNHAEVGSLISRRWGFPDEICYAILNHHNSTQAENPRFIEHIIEIADMMANFNGYGNRFEEQSKLLFSEPVMKLGLSSQFLDNIWESSKPSIDEVISTFG
jgi:putative nucleotidyltransferase with HDIG domain